MIKKIVSISIIMTIILIIGMFIFSSYNIKNSLLLPKNLEIKDMKEELVCIDFLVLQHENIVIDSDDLYQKLLKYKSMRSTCKDYSLPKIDFKRHILVGKYTEKVGCTVTYEKTAELKSLNSINYNIDSKKKGNCSKLGVSMNWGLIKKPQNNRKYDVNFVVN